MKREAKITSRGQITVPLEVRRLLRVKPGDRLVFDGNGLGMRIHPVRTENPFEKYRGIGNPGIGTGEKAVIQWVRRLRGR